MFKNYFKVALRNLLKKKVYSLINIFGLAIGLATCLLIMLYVVNEWNYDTFNERADRTFRVYQNMTSDVRDDNEASTPFPLAEVLNAEFPNLIEKSVRFFDMQEPNHTFLNREDQVSFRESNFYFVDSTFFDVFSGKLSQGSPKEALKKPLSLVLSEELVEKYFKGENPIGQTLSYKGITEMTVTGVMETWPEQSHMDIDLVASFNSLDEIYDGSTEYDISWLWNPVWTYVVLKDGVQPEELSTQFSAIEDNYYYAYNGWPADERVELGLQPITDIHLRSNMDMEMQPNSSISYIYILLIVAAFILIIACINFMNLSTARSMERSREVGMRKVLGGYKNQLFVQFIGESLMITFIAIIIGVALVFVALPYFNELVSLELSFGLFDHLYTLPALLLFALFVGVFAGLYPAVYLSSFNPTEVLKGGSRQKSGGIFFRKVLVTFQFALSVILIIGTSIIYLQLQHIQDKDMGFEEESVVMLPMKQNLTAWEYPAFKQQALTHSKIQTVAGLGKIPGSEQQEYYRYVPANTGEDQDGLNHTLFVTHDAIEAFDMEIIAGRSFSEDYPSDPDNAVLINRSMLARMDIEDPAEGLGEIIYFYPPDGERESYTVVGVLEDFNYTSIKEEIEPLVVRLVEGTYPVLRSIEHLAVKLAPGDPSDGIKHLEKVWSDINHIDPFEYRFLDERLAEIYEAETTMNTMSTSFSILCILIACLGLLGLSSYSAQLRQQEIGIRKSMGATVGNIIGLLSKEYLILILIANVIAWPVSYYIAQQWLDNFPYRFDLFASAPFLFVGAAFSMILLAMGTVSYHSVKAAMINPIDAIRSE